MASTYQAGKFASIAVDRYRPDTGELTVGLAPLPDENNRVAPEMLRQVQALNSGINTNFKWKESALAFVQTLQAQSNISYVGGGLISSVLAAGSGASQGGVANVWTNPGNITLSDNVYATQLASTTAAQNEFIAATNFGFNIPSDATILGVVCDVEASVSSGSTLNTSNFNTVQLTKDGTTNTGSNQGGLIQSWSTTDRTCSFGSSTSLWGATLTPSEVNTSTFGVRIRMVAVSITLPIRFDQVKLTVYYQTHTSDVLSQTQTLLAPTPKFKWKETPLAFTETLLSPTVKAKLQMSTRAFVQTLLAQTNKFTLTGQNTLAFTQNMNLPISYEWSWYGVAHTHGGTDFLMGSVTTTSPLISVVASDPASLQLFHNNYFMNPAFSDGWRTAGPDTLTDYVLGDYAAKADGSGGYPDDFAMRTDGYEYFYSFYDDAASSHGAYVKCTNANVGAATIIEKIILTAAHAFVQTLLDPTIVFTPSGSNETISASLLAFTQSLLSPTVKETLAMAVHAYVQALLSPTPIAKIAPSVHAFTQTPLSPTPQFKWKESPLAFTYDGDPGVATTYTWTFYNDSGMSSPNGTCQTTSLDVAAVYDAANTAGILTSGMPSDWASASQLELLNMSVSVLATPPSSYTLLDDGTEYRFAYRRGMKTAKDVYLQWTSTSTGTPGPTVIETIHPTVHAFVQSLASVYVTQQQFIQMVTHAFNQTMQDPTIKAKVNPSVHAFVQSLQGPTVKEFIVMATKAFTQALQNPAVKEIIKPNVHAFIETLLSPNVFAGVTVTSSLLAFVQSLKSPTVKEIIKPGTHAFIQSLLDPFVSGNDIIPITALAFHQTMFAPKTNCVIHPSVHAFLQSLKDPTINQKTLISSTLLAFHQTGNGPTVVSIVKPDVRAFIETLYGPTVNIGQRISISALSFTQSPKNPIVSHTVHIVPLAMIQSLLNPTVRSVITPTALTFIESLLAPSVKEMIKPGSLSFTQTGTSTKVNFTFHPEVLAFTQSMYGVLFPGNVAIVIDGPLVFTQSMLDALLRRILTELKTAVTWQEMVDNNGSVRIVDHEENLVYTLNVVNDALMSNEVTLTVTLNSAESHTLTLQDHTAESVTLSTDAWIWE